MPATTIIRIEDDTSTSGMLNPLPPEVIGFNALARFIFGLMKKIVIWPLFFILPAKEQRIQIEMYDSYACAYCRLLIGFIDYRCLRDI
tara:strand:- start:744 stop:1007 length:264 start_codon:yes stop_codon:yes gene_type:complete